MKEYPHNSKYIITEDGKVYSKKTKKFLSHSVKEDGYLLIGIDGSTKRLHRLVAETYILNPENLPEVNHKDGVKSNCHRDNLEWVTSKQNKDHAWKMGLYKDICEDHCHAIHDNVKIHRACQMMQDGYRNIDIATSLGIHKDSIAHIRNGTAWKEISKEYKLKVKRVQRKSLETVLMICTLLEDNMTNSEVASVMGGIAAQEVGRIRKGETHRDISKNFKIPKSKFSRVTEREVIDICSLLEGNMKNKAVADAVGVSTSVVSKIKRRLVWQHISCNYNW